MKIRWFRVNLTAVVSAALLVPTGCGGSGEPTPTTNPSSSSSQVTGTVTVLAAASLTGAFTRIGKDFEAANPGTRVVFSFGGSSALANQINSGAPADVFASASPTNMKTVTDADNALGQPQTFVRNQLVIAVPAGNPNRVTGLADLARPGLKVALCAGQVPCGAAAKKVLGAAGVDVTPVTYELDVKATLTKLKLGEVDAALVYRTDVKAETTTVDGIEFPGSSEAINDYPVVVLKNSRNPEAANAFLAYVLGDRAREILVDAGFQEPRQPR